MTIYKLEDISPTLHQPSSNWIAPSAMLIGDVIIEPKVSIWFGAVLRGDNEPITIKENANIQENCVLHTDPSYPLTIGKGCTIGHQVILHGCEIGENTLIGMGATILNGAKIGANSIVGANSLVSENKSFPDGTLILGTPAKHVRDLSEEEISKNERSAGVHKRR